MERVYVLERDICSSYTDLTIVPCSGKMKQVEKPRNQHRIDIYGLPTPYDLRDKFTFGEVSPLFPPQKNAGKIKFFAFAATVVDRSKPERIENIGKQIGTITRNNPQIRIVETPFLGCGDGGLFPREAMTALARGFLATSHPDAVLQLCSDCALSASEARNAIAELLSTMESNGEGGMGDGPLLPSGEEQDLGPLYINKFINK